MARLTALVAFVDLWLTRLLDAMVIGLAGLLFCLLNYAVFTRFLVLSPASSSVQELPAHVLAVLTFIGAAYLTRTSEHLGFDAVVRILRPGLKRAVMACNLVLMAGFRRSLPIPAASAGIFGSRVRISVTCHGAFPRPAAGRRPHRADHSSPALAARHRAGAPRRSLARKRRVMFLDPGWIILILLVVLLVAGLPIAFVLGVTAATMIGRPGGGAPDHGPDPLRRGEQLPAGGRASVHDRGRGDEPGPIAEKLIAFASSLVGHIRGGLAHVNILTSLFFSEISGTATSDAAAIGSVMIPQMKKRGYPAAFAAAVTSTRHHGDHVRLSAVLILVRPATRDRRAFAAGILPGVMVCALLMVTAYVISVKRGYPTEGAFSFGRVIETGKDAVIPLTLPVLILVGILGGIFTATEAGAIAAFWSIILAAFLYRTIRLGNLLDTFRIAGKRSAMLMFIVATSTLLGWYLTNQRIPQDIAMAILGISDNYWVVLAAINIFFLLAGTIIHGTPAILMLVPIFLPLADQLGIDRVHFGLILTINLGIGQQTPPVASVVLITCAIAKISIAKIIPSMLWFIGAMLVALILVNVFPAIVLWLPSVIL
ncbi:MAG: TRAP transporter large permease subunit [Paracoccaceae bacterium]